MAHLRWWISVFYTIPVCLLVTGFLIAVSLCALPFDSRGKATESLYRFWARAILAICRVKVRYYGIDRIDPARRYICIANHSSLIDIPLLVADFPLRLCFLAKEELFHIPLFGTYLRRMHHIPVSRADSRAAARSMASAARKIAGGSHSVLLFPEGTRSATGLGEFKEGAALLAIRSGVPILPLAICGTRQIWPARSIVITPGTAEVHVGEEVATVGMPPSARGELTGRLRQEIEVLLEA
jgi:1-acyl-sn-glycerol-3-phosphate acyltransferase